METIITLLISLIILFSSPSVSVEEKRVELDRTVSTIHVLLDGDRIISEPPQIVPVKNTRCSYKGKSITCP